jgi:hypothetical protein
MAVLVDAQQPARRRWARRAPQAGAAAVETALVLSAVVLPLLLGVLTYGQYFWQAQHVDLYQPRLPEASIVGTFTCAELVDQVKATVQGALPAVQGATGNVLPLSDIGVQVLDVLPTVGATVKVSVSVPVDTSLGGLVPLPNGGNVLTEATYRLDNVALTTSSCR